MRKGGLEKRVAFLLEPREVKAPELAQDFEVIYCWCPRRLKVDEATGECHNCMGVIGGEGWTHCETKKGIIGEFGAEAYVLLAGGQPIEKWRHWTHVQVSNREASTVWQLLWCAPFSNSHSHDFPVILRGGRLQLYDGGLVETVYVHIKIKGWEWKLAPGEWQVNEWMDYWLQNQ